MMSSLGILNRWSAIKRVPIHKGIGKDYLWGGLIYLDNNYLNY